MVVPRKVSVVTLRNIDERHVCRYRGFCLGALLLSHIKSKSSYNKQALFFITYFYIKPYISSKLFYNKQDLLIITDFFFIIDEWRIIQVIPI
jgi:hypothetical protein